MNFAKRININNPIVAGCGKFVEGDAKDMYNALYTTLGTLPKDTKIYCGHECGMANLQFANTIDPSNQHIRVSLYNVYNIYIELWVKGG